MTLVEDEPERGAAVDPPVDGELLTEYSIPHIAGRTIVKGKTIWPPTAPEDEQPSAQTETSHTPGPGEGIQLTTVFLLEAAAPQSKPQPMLREKALA